MSALGQGIWYRVNSPAANTKYYTPQVGGSGPQIILPANGATYNVHITCASLCTLTGWIHDYNNGAETQMASFSGVTGINFTGTTYADGASLLGPAMQSSIAQAWIQVSIQSVTSGFWNSGPRTRRAGAWPNLQHVKWQVRRSGVWVPIFWQQRRSGIWVGI